MVWLAEHHGPLPPETLLVAGNGPVDLAAKPLCLLHNVPGAGCSRGMERSGDCVLHGTSAHDMARPGAGEVGSLAELN